MMRQACYGTLGYRPTDPSLRRLSLLQFYEAMIGHRDAQWAKAGIINAALQGIGPGGKNSTTTEAEYEEIKRAFGVV